MAWNYDLSALATDAMTQVRALIQDVQADDPQLQDEEISFILAQFPKPTGKMPYMAAVAACDMLAMKYAREVNNSIGPLSESAQQRYEHYVALAQSLRVQLATDGAGIVPGRLILAAPILGGGGPTYLGGPNSYTGSDY